MGRFILQVLSTKAATGGADKSVVTQPHNQTLYGKSQDHQKSLTLKLFFKKRHN